MAMWTLCLMVARVPTGLPDSLEFRRVGAAELRTELQPLLQTSYVATPDDELRLDYSARDLAWMLDAPGVREELRVGLGCRDEPGLIGFVCAVPCGLLVRGEQVDAVEVSLLCMHRDWRGRGLTKELILELRRRADAAGIRCAIFTEARPRHTLPLLRAECFHRPLRARALLRYGFWRPPAGDEGGDTVEQSRRQLHAAADLASQLPLHASLAPTSARLPACSLRRMRHSDADACHQFLLERSRRFELAPSFTPEQFEHRFLGGGAFSFVLARRAHHGRRPDETDVLGFVSFSLLPLRSSDGGRLVQAQLLGYAVAPHLADTADGALTEHALLLLLSGALRIAKARGAHVFNAHALAELTPDMLARLGFGRGDEASYVCIDGPSGAQRDSKRLIDPARACWLPLL